LDRKGGTHSLVPLFSSLYSSGFFLLEVCGDIVNHENVQNVRELFDRTVRTVEYITNGMLANTLQKTEHLDVCHATDGAHIKVY
jgi:hypothetical protein